MPYLNMDDGMDELPKVEGLSDAEYRQMMRDARTWSRTGQASPLVRELLDLGMIRRAPRHWLPDRLHTDLPRYRAKITSAVRGMVYARDSWACRECGATSPLTLDHLVPWSLGGSDDESNLQTLCRSCNSRKGARV